MECNAFSLALNAEGGVPDWVQLTPPGPQLAGRDGRTWSMDNPEAVIAACRDTRGGSIEIPLDFEHATHVKGARGERADAAGWVRDMAVRGGAIWGRVEWNQAGRDAVASRGYRFISPSIDFDKMTGAVRRIVSAGLTNLPNFTMPALNRPQEQPALDPEILKALCLAPDAGLADVLAAIAALTSAEITAANRAQLPDPARFVPIEAVRELMEERALNRAAASEEVANARVQSAMDAGYLTPGMRDWAVALCRADPASFDTFVKTATPSYAKLFEPAPRLSLNRERRQSARSAEEAAVFSQLGLDANTGS